MVNNNQKESSVLGCGYWVFNIFVSLIFLTIYWDKVVHSNYWPYLLAVWVVTILALIWWYLIHKK